ncbi:bacteriophage abortive infection AbiH family protein [Sphingobacterium sp. SRCM116780]|uniref:AbiH family protein n=1 Tax=Sphingobacterium sp. SRCM116780 TaxID=2907623 RepID=UPI001F2FFFAB|nr:AbiH family protein [Sphingobacterium sp. SRCM116780]UIR56961.1 bacteriophage abortive infection AbiH family protein [Sphingobacterium sp. SRCM116780]
MLKRSNKIFLIGNGFDLNHGLKTSYRNFIVDYLKNSFISAQNQVKGIYQDECFEIQVNHDCEINLMFKDLESLDNMIKSPRIDISDGVFNYFDENIQIRLIPKNDFVRFILKECFESDWNGIEDAILRFLKTSHSKLVQDKSVISIHRKKSILYCEEYENIKSLNDSVACLKSKLIDYLKTQNSPISFKDYLFRNHVDWGNKFKQSSQMDTVGNTERNVLFLNFNYTNYITSISAEVKRNVDDYYTNFEIVNIHGDIHSNIDNVIFGIGDEQNDFYSEIETLYDDEWLKSMKSFHYFRTSSYSKLLGFIAKGNYEIYILGHSCSITDRTLLNMLFEDKYCQKIHVFHYSGMESYLTTTYNIARNFKDKVKLRSVLQHFNEALKME